MNKTRKNDINGIKDEITAAIERSLNKNRKDDIYIKDEISTAEIEEILNENRKNGFNVIKDGCVDI